MIHLLSICLLAAPIIQDQSGYTPQKENPWQGEEKKPTCPKPWLPPKKKAPKPVAPLE